MDIASLPRRVLEGERRALARTITLVENQSAGVSDLLAALFPHTGKAHRVGVTGAPGTGKSTLVNALAQAARQRNLTLGILAVDPTSPFTGGAILGDRIRMHDLSGDPGIFIRSMATRGSLGGLARATSAVVEVLDAAGFDIVLIETVGAGQSEVDVAKMAQTTIVIEAPGLGDDIQAIKAGILEIADVLVVNKADQPRADHTFSALRAMLDMTASPPAYAGHHGSLASLSDSMNDDGPDPTDMVEDAPEVVWEVPILKTVATEGEGIEALLDTVQEHRTFLVESGGLAARERVRVASDLEARLREALLVRLLASIDSQEIERTIQEVLTRNIDPHTAVANLIRHA